ncbi:MAG: DUF2061 domain-containing protein [Candidatus Bathyarchaeia archaeon]
MPLQEKIKHLRDLALALETMSIEPLIHHGNRSKWTSLAKTITWRIIASTTTAIIAYYITGSLEVAGVVGMIDMVVKLIFYYGHERAWLKLGQRINGPKK